MLEHLDLSSSSIMKIQYGSADVNEEVIDMSQLTNLTFLSFDSATSLTEIKYNAIECFFKTKEERHFLLI